MEIYRVGGAVRDELLGRACGETDWVVVGATPEEMEALGYRQVGRDFPVFLHPETGEEYALARTERKIGAGHTGFVCHAGTEVTLEEDLARRDLTINAMAQDGDGRLIDPWGGRADLERRLLRHVSPAFVEDPLRVLRVARFAAELAAYEFELAPETRDLMRDMCAGDDLAELAAERIWQELAKALAAPAPSRFFEVLADCDGLVPWFLEVQGHVEALGALWSRVAPQLPEALDRFAALGWILLAEDLDRLCRRVKVPNDYRRLAILCARHGRALLEWRRQSGTELLELGKAIGMLRQADRFDRVLRVVGACAETELTPLVRAAERARAVSARPFAERGLSGIELGRALDAERARVLDEARLR